MAAPRWTSCWASACTQSSSAPRRARSLRCAVSAAAAAAAAAAVCVCACAAVAVAVCMWTARCARGWLPALAPAITRTHHAPPPQEDSTAYSLKCNISVEVNYLHQGITLGLVEDRCDAPRAAAARGRQRSRTRRAQGCLWPCSRSATHATNHGPVPPPPPPKKNTHTRAHPTHAGRRTAPRRAGSCSSRAAARSRGCHPTSLCR
jgi:hypothetical protein